MTYFLHLNCSCTDYMNSINPSATAPLTLDQMFNIQVAPQCAAKFVEITYIILYTTKNIFQSDNFLNSLCPYLEGTKDALCSATSSEGSRLVRGLFYGGLLWWLAVLCHSLVVDYTVSSSSYSWPAVQVRGVVYAIIA